MKDIYKKKFQELMQLFNAYEKYNGKPKHFDFESLKIYFAHLLANSKKVKVVCEDIDEKFKMFEDLI